MELETITLVTGYAGASALIDVLAPSYRRAGWPVVYVSPHDAPLTCAGLHLHAGVSSRKPGIHMLQRLLAQISAVLNLPWEVCLILQYDQYVVDRAPSYPGGLGCCVLDRLQFQYPPAQDYVARQFCGVPWMFDRKTAHHILAVGEHLLDENLLEGGNDDRFLGLICERAGIPLRSLPGTCCKWDQGIPTSDHDPLDVTAWIYHPVKSLAQIQLIDRAIGAL